MNGNTSELEAMKQEILKEMRKEISKAKLEIIEGKIFKVSSNMPCSRNIFK